MRESAQTAAPGFQETFWRTLQTFTVTRVVIALVLLGYLSVNAKRGGFWSAEEYLYLQICAIYLGLAIGFAFLAGYFKRRFLLQVTSQIAADIAVISMLYVAAGGARSGLAILYLFPLAGGAILAPLLLALFFVSAVALVMLAESSYQLLSLASETFVSQAGLYGAAFFAAVFVINRLAARLISQEKLAVQRGQDLLMQQAINRLAIADMGDGILVIGRDTTVFTCNPAAQRMLGMAFSGDKPRDKLTEISPLTPIADAFHAWMAQPDAAAPAFVMIKPGEDPSQQAGNAAWSARRELASHLKLRFAAVQTDGMTEERTIIFLQDVSDIENQAQQLKLASMGRLTASIAHEVRNPLSAISYAASLLSEEASDPAQTRLLHIIGENVTRLNQMIEDILKLSRKAQSYSGPVLLPATLSRILDEFQETHGVKKGIVELADMGQYQVWFDPLHLHEVVVNLLSNAMRYASGAPASVRMYLRSDGGNRLELHVQDDGPAITPEVRAHLFEPFYTTSSKGTGLGLYVARELCLNNGAMLDYEYRADTPEHAAEEAQGRFVITFAVPHAA